jgi:hypothetical protein
MVPSAAFEATFLKGGNHSVSFTGTGRTALKNRRLPALSAVNDGLDGRTFRRSPPRPPVVCSGLAGHFNGDGRDDIVAFTRRGRRCVRRVVDRSVVRGQRREMA